MKARMPKVFCTEAEISEEVNREWQKREREVFEAVKQDIVAQLMATCCLELEKEFGFGTKRLTQFKDGVEGLFKMMLSGVLDGRKFDTDDCIRYIRDKHGIDFDAGG